MTPWILAYLGVGAGIGLLAGLLGIGGGMVIVPILAALFAAQALSAEHTLHLALGTAMAGVLFTAAASVRTHHRFGAVDWTVARQLGLPMGVGTLAAASLSAWMPQRALALAFASIVLVASVQIWFGRQPTHARGLPGANTLRAVGLGIGVVCGFVAAGGAFLATPFMLWCGVPIKRAIGTGAAVGLPVSALGTVGYVWAGWQAPGLPAGTLGFVLLPALAGVVAASMLTAPLGARLAHRLPVGLLRRGFALMLFLLAARMASSFW